MLTSKSLTSCLIASSSSHCRRTSATRTFSTLFARRSSKKSNSSRRSAVERRIKTASHRLRQLLTPCLSSFAIVFHPSLQTLTIRCSNQVLCAMLPMISAHCLKPVKKSVRAQTAPKEATMFSQVATIRSNRARKLTLD